MLRMILDTETAGNQFDTNNRMIRNTGLVYDIGFSIVDECGNVKESHSLIIKDIFFGQAEIMQSAYYSNKIPDYLNDLIAGNRKAVSFWDARWLVLNALKRYNINEVGAHNAWFDLGVLNNTQNFLTNGKYKYFFPYDVNIFDTLAMSRQVLKENNKYKEFCNNNHFLTAKGQPQFTAEVLYRFLTNNLTFQESHTGLEDVQIEKEIYSFCVRNGIECKNILEKYKKKD